MGLLCSTARCQALSDLAYAVIWARKHHREMIRTMQARTRINKARGNDVPPAIQWCDLKIRQLRHIRGLRLKAARIHFNELNSCKSFAAPSAN